MKSGESSSWREESCYEHDPGNGKISGKGDKKFLSEAGRDTLPLPEGRERERSICFSMTRKRSSMILFRNILRAALRRMGPEFAPADHGERGMESIRGFREYQNGFRLRKT